MASSTAIRPEAMIGAYKIRGELAERGIPVVLGPPSHPFITGGEVSMTADLYNLMSEYNAALLTEAGVKIAIASFGFGFGSFGGATQGRWLLIEAAWLIFFIVFSRLIFHFGVKRYSGFGG